MTKNKLFMYQMICIDCGKVFRDINGSYQHAKAKNHEIHYYISRQINEERVIKLFGFYRDSVLKTFRSDGTYNTDLIT